jgi:folate-binding protein YgfZ
VLSILHVLLFFLALFLHRLRACVSTDWALTEFEPITDDEYHCVRIANGIFDGASDAVSGDSIALECNVEWLNGASFEKGCYLGQELMARAHFTGLVRKRLVPVRLTLASESSTGSQLFEFPALQNDRILPYEFAVGSHDAAGSAPVAFESGAPIKLGAKSVGKLFSTRGRVAMAMMRLEHLQKQVAAAAEFRVRAVDGREWRATPYAPATWPPLEDVFQPTEE